MSRSSDPKLEIMEEALKYLLDNAKRRFGSTSEEVVDVLENLSLFYRRYKGDKGAVRQCDIELLDICRQRQDGNRLVWYMWGHYYNRPNCKERRDNQKQDFELIMRTLSDVTHYENCDETIIGDAKYTMAGIHYQMGTYHSLTHSLTESLTHSLSHSLTHPITHSPTHSLTHSLTHSPTH